MNLIRIDSGRNPVVKAAALLRREPSEERFLVEGTRFAEEIPSRDILQVFVTDPEKHRAFLSRLDPETPVYLLSSGAMDKICAAVSGQTVACAVKKSPVPRPDKLILLDRVQDPGNVGTVIRSAYAFGFGVILSPGCANPYAPKTLMASAGALRTCFVEQSDNLAETVRALKTDGFSVCAAALDNTAVAPEELPRAEKRAIIVGNEGRGISETVLKEADRTVMIPMSNPINSLNAAAAAAILLYLRK